MDPTNNIATDLFYKIRSRFSGLKLGDANGSVTINTEEARFFDFDYKDGDLPIGHVSISLSEENSMKVYFSTGITESMNPVQKQGWYGFLKELRLFAKRRLLAFDTRDIAKDNLDKRDYTFLSKNSSINKSSVGESVMNESQLYGTRTMSFQKLMDTRLIIKHSKTLEDDMQPGARSRNISALFVENQDGERFKYPFIHLAGARAMQRHVANGGVPYDEVGKSVIGMSEEIAQLKSFGAYVVRNDLMNSDTNNIVEQSQQALEQLRERIARLSKQSYYEQYKESFESRQPLEVPHSVVEDYKDKFTVKSFKEEIESVFPILYRLMKENNCVDYEDIVSMTTENTNDEADVDLVEEEDEFAKFEQWVMNLGEESPIASEDEEVKAQALKELQELVKEPFPIGVDGTNAIESLKGIIEDPQLYKGIKETAKEDPEADLRGAIQQYLQLYAPDVLEQLDFGDFDANAGAESPEEEPQMAGDDPDERNKKDSEDDLPFEPDDKSPSAKDEFGNTIKHRARHLARKGMRQAMDVKEVAEFINSFYDRDSGTFPKGPEGVVVMVGKKFGEQAESVARKFVERMAPHQEASAEQMQELARIRELSGLQSEEQQTTEASDRTLDMVADRLREKGVKYSPDNEKEIINMIGDEMQAMGMSAKTIRYLISYDEDFIPDVLDGLEREPDDGPKEPMHPQARDYAQESDMSESQDDIFTITNPDLERDAETGREEPDQIEVKVEFSSYDDEFEIDKVIRLDTKEDITDKVLNDRKLYFSLAQDVQQREQGRERDYESIQDDVTPELEAIKRLSGISQGLGY